MSTTITLKDHYKAKRYVTLDDPIAVADIFDKAADNITADTWTSGTLRRAGWYGAPDRMCALGHLRFADHGSTGSASTDERSVAVERVAGTLDIIGYNDTHGRKPYQVKRRLKTIARQIRKQAEKAAKS